MKPEVRYLLLCDDVQPAADNWLRLNLQGLITHIRSTSVPPFPVACAHFCVLVILTGCGGTAELSLAIRHAATGAVIFRNLPRPIRFVDAPEDAVGFKFRIENCAFPAEGQYWVQLIYSGTVLAQQPLSVTARG